MVANPRASDSVVTAAMSSTRVLLCYRAVDSSNYMKCNGMNIPWAQGFSSSQAQGQANTGPGLLIYTSTTNITLTRFSDTEALLCYQNASNSMFGSCTALKMDGLSLSKGPNYVVNHGATGAISATSLSESSALMCYCGGDSLQCNMLTRAGLFLTRDADLALNLVRPVEIAVASVSLAKAVVCWRGTSSSSAGTCSVLNVADSSKGPDLGVTIGSLQAQSWYASLAALTDRVVVLCYQDVEDGKFSGTCKTLRVVGMSLRQGPNLLMGDSPTVGSSGIADISVARLSDVLAVVCYRGGMISYYTTCNGLNLYGASLTKGADLVVQNKGAGTTSLSVLTDTSALVCYHTPGTSKAVCNVLMAHVPVPSPMTTVTTTKTTFAVVGRASNAADRSCALGMWAWAFALGTMASTSFRWRGGQTLMT